MEYKNLRITYQSVLTPEKINKMLKYWEKIKGIGATVCSVCGKLTDKAVFIKGINNDNLYIIPICRDSFKIEGVFSVLNNDLYHS